MAKGWRFMHPALAFVVLAWGCNFVAIKFAYTGFTPAAAGLLRYLVMWPLLVAWCVAARIPLRYPPGRFWPTVVAGFWGSGAYMVVFLEGLRLANPAHASAALATAPILTVAFSVLTGTDKLTLRLVAGSLVAYSGVATMALGGADGDSGLVTGTVLVAVSAVFWAWSVICYRRLMPEQSPLQALTLSFPGAMAVMAVYGAWPLATTDFGAVPGQAWWAMAYFTLVAGVLAFAAYYRGLSDVGPAKTSLTQYFIPPTTALAAWLATGKPLGGVEWAGLALVLAGVALAQERPAAVTTSA